MSNCLLHSEDNLLKVVALNYKFRDLNKPYQFEFKEYNPLSNSRIDITSGNELEAIQPIGILQNLSDKILTFKARFEIYNNSVKKLIYRRNVNVSHDCLKLPDTSYCEDIPYLKARYCQVDFIDGFYKSSNLPYPVENDLIGIPPGGFVQVDFAPFFSNDFLNNHKGNCKVSLIAIPIVPETGDTLIDGYTQDDTLSFELNLLEKQCAEVYYPFDSDTIESSNNYFYSLSNKYNAQTRRVEFSKSESFDKIEFTKTNLVNENLKFDESSAYYWRLYIKSNDTVCISPYKSFYVKGVSSAQNEEVINKFSIIPNPATDYITINLSKKGLKPFASNEVKVEVYDVMGVLIHSTPSASQPPLNEGNLKIDVSNLAPGVYFVKIVGSNGASSIVEKFVKI